MNINCKVFTSLCSFTEIHMDPIKGFYTERKFVINYTLCTHKVALFREILIRLQKQMLKGKEKLNQDCCATLSLFNNVSVIIGMH